MGNRTASGLDQALALAWAIDGSNALISSFSLLHHRMSYTDDRDDMAELFGLENTADKAYSEDLTELKSDSSTIGSDEKDQDLSPPRKESANLPPRREQEATGKAPAQKVTIRKPVKLRPPQESANPPESKSPSRSDLHPETPDVIDEEITVYSELEAPDLGAAGPITFEKEETKPKKSKSWTGLRNKVKQADSLPEPSKEETAPDKAHSLEKSLEDSPPIKVSDISVTPEAKVSEPPRAPESSSREFASEQRPAGENKRDHLLKTHGLVKIYDGRTVVNGVDINVRPGEIVGLLGPNGAGKTTSFYMIVGLVPPNEGKVMFNNQDVTQLPMYQRARLGMGYLPQEESIFRKLTVEENIMAVMETLDISKKERIQRCEDLLERFSITHIRKNIALTCSGGEKRRLTIARSLVTTPSLLMLDEPFSGVDPIAVNEIQSIVEDLRKSGLAILITDHNARQTLELVDRAYLIYEGKVLREGTRDFLINDPVSRELYLGDQFTM